MRIAYLTSVYPAPSHTFIRREVEALRARGLQIDTFSVRAPSHRSAPEDRTSYDTTHYLLPAGLGKVLGALGSAVAYSPSGCLRTLLLALQHRTPGVKSLVWSVFYFVEAMLFAQELRRRNITHVHNHFANPSASVSYLATRFLNLPWSLTLHGPSETDYPAGVLLGSKLIAADFVNCVCHYQRAQAYRTVPSHEWSKLQIVRCGLDIRRYPKRTAAPARAPLRIICVARLARDKGHSGLLRAFKRVRTVAPSELVLIGDGPERERISREIRDLGLSGHVHLYGSLPESATMAEIAMSDVLVLASLMEGLPVVLMEAMALGVPVIAPNVAGIPELIQDGKNGFMYAPGDWDGLFDRMRFLLSSPMVRQSLADAGRTTVEAHFDIHQVIEPMLERFRTADRGVGTRPTVPPPRRQQVVAIPVASSRPKQK